MNKGGDLHHRGNRKTVGQKPWYKITGSSALSILRSLFDELLRIEAVKGMDSAEKVRKDGKKTYIHT